MIIKPMIRNNICLNAHPQGCAVSVKRQIEFAKKNLSPIENKTPKLALIIGCSNGYGLASRICTGFGFGAVTVGVSKEKEASGNHTATPGFYNNAAFDREAEKAGLVSISLNGDAFSDVNKAATADAVRKAAAKANIPAKIDLIVYSLASPVRTDPKTGVMYKSAIKPIGAPFSGKTLNMMNGTFHIMEAEAANEEEIFNTVKVMGGEDWELWMDALDREGLLAPVTRTIAYTYLGPELSWSIYKNGTIGKAKEDLERACREINEKFTSHGKICGAWVSVNKALVTRSSSVIPIIPFYISCLFKEMKEKGIHEGCIEQIVRLYRDRLYSADGSVPVDGENRIRMDDWEMREDVQKAVVERMNIVTSENVFAETDVAGFKHDFMEAHGFDVEGINYGADVEIG
ncbi:MAG: trans-2-enoyl-CoA reductase family protein [Treponema sp.]|jgi:enoyl-[acyl-carrier protein] reductase/trans-2-enoyl-CoA reductase (NAD+)|nr:trans-2-enoyl-CoA reductase family protein [Treponema sp.]